MLDVKNDVVATPCGSIHRGGAEYGSQILEEAQSEAAAVAQRLFVLVERIGVADARPPKPYGTPGI